MRPQEIIDRKFSRSFRGYDIAEVDEFLDEIVRDMERADQDVKLLELRNRLLLERLAKHGIPLSDDTPTKTQD